MSHNHHCTWGGKSLRSCRKDGDPVSVPLPQYLKNETWPAKDKKYKQFDGLIILYCGQKQKVCIIYFKCKVISLHLTETIWSYHMISYTAFVAQEYSSYAIL